VLGTQQAVIVMRLAVGIIQQMQHAQPFLDALGLHLAVDGVLSLQAAGTYTLKQHATT